MRYALMVEPQEGMTYTAQLELALAAEAAGFEAFFRSDHWLSLEGEEERPATDAWAVLAGLARETRSIRLGTLVSPITFRLPAAIAKIVATVDEMSGGRVELGLGAGWHDPEHERFGIPYPPLGERFERLGETLEIVLGLWTRPRFTFAGRHYAIRDAACEPKPVQRPHPPLIVGGYGKPKTVALAARYATELNLDSPAPDACPPILARLDEACRAIGRDPATVVRSAMIPWPEGSPEAQAALVNAYQAAGLGRLYLNVGAGTVDRAAITAFGRAVVAPGRTDEAP